MAIEHQPAPPEGLTIPELLCRRAQEQPDRVGYTFLADGESERLDLTYAQAHRRAAAVAALLRDRGVVPGDRVLLVLPPGLDYATAFLGCLHAGAVAVPVYPPNPFRLAQTLPRLLGIVRDAGPTLALTISPVLGLLDEVERLAGGPTGMGWAAVDGPEAGAGGGPGNDPGPAAVAPRGTALLQYTSGSTASPKGVMVTHDNLVHNSAFIHRVFGTSPDSRGASWLPPYHDMGLIGGLLQPLYGGFPVVLMSPLHFLEDPMRWLRVVHRFGVTTSGGPNFAFDLCARRAAAADLGKLDLGSWQVAFNGAEPIRAETLNLFADTFGPCGFRPESFLPCYGLAEATLIVTGAGGRAPAAALPPRPPVTVAVDRAGLELGSAVAAADGASAVPLVSCGDGADDQDVAVVDPATGVRVEAGRVGEIWVSGPSVAAGYWRRVEESEAAFGARITGGDPAARYLRTGDLGFLRDGELVVTGRLADLLVVRGRNHYPQDLEATAEWAHPALRPGCSAAFLDEDGAVVTVHELRGDEGDLADVAAQVRRRIAEDHGLQVRCVVLVGKGGIPKTSSGKVQRGRCRARFLAGDLPERHRAGIAPGPGHDHLDPADPAEPAEATSPLEVYVRDRVAGVTGLPRGAWPGRRR